MLSLSEDNINTSSKSVSLSNSPIVWAILYSPLSLLAAKRGLPSCRVFSWDKESEIVSPLFNVIFNVTAETSLAKEVSASKAEAPVSKFDTEIRSSPKTVFPSSLLFIGTILSLFIGTILSSCAE